MKQIISKFWILVGLLILGIGANAQTNKKNIYVYMGDSVVFKAKASEVDSVALEEEKTVVKSLQPRRNKTLQRSICGCRQHFVFHENSCSRPARH